MYLCIYVCNMPKQPTSPSHMHTRRYSRLVTQSSPSLPLYVPIQSLTCPLSHLPTYSPATPIQHRKKNKNKNKGADTLVRGKEILGTRHMQHYHYTTLRYTRLDWTILHCTALCYTRNVV